MIELTTLSVSALKQGHTPGKDRLNTREGLASRQAATTATSNAPSTGLLHHPYALLQTNTLTPTHHYPNKLDEPYTRSRKSSAPGLEGGNT